MDHFHYRNLELHCEDVTASAIAQQFGTPCYVYSQTTLIDHYDRFQSAFAPLDPLICYSIKSCSNINICQLLAERGAGMDLVSGGELHRALKAGVDPQKCVFAGVGKTDTEIETALLAGVGWLNVESEQEFQVVARIAKRMHKTCRVALRVNPDVDPHTHRHTTTGLQQTKFGVDIDAAAAFFHAHGSNRYCQLRGVHLHLGSPIYSTKPYLEAIDKALKLIDQIHEEGGRVEMLDLGGGFGADYETNQTPLATQYARDIVPALSKHVERGLRVILEPGRMLTANAGVLLLRVLFVKESGGRRFVVCDGGMNVLLRPSHYEAFHFIWPCTIKEQFLPPRRSKQLDLPGLIPVDVVGPVCETGDFLARNRALPPIQRGNLLAVFSAGAYGMSMASRYNSQPLPPEVLVCEDAVSFIRRRETYDDLTDHEPVVLTAKVASDQMTNSESPP